jgi:hypothetical protein
MPQPSTDERETTENTTTAPKPAREENVPPEAKDTEDHDSSSNQSGPKAPRLDRPGGGEQANEALKSAAGAAKEKALGAFGALGSALRSVQNTDPAAVGRKTSKAVERGASETTNFLKTVTATTVTFGTGVAVGLARGGPAGLSDSALETLRMRGGEGVLTEVAVQTGTERYEENGVPKARVYVQFLEEHADLAPAIRAEDSELPEGMAAIPLDLAYEVTVRSDESEIESFAVPLTGEADGERETYGFLVLDREEGNPEVYAYNNA